MSAEAVGRARRSPGPSSTASGFPGGASAVEPTSSSSCVVGFSDRQVSDPLATRGPSGTTDPVAGSAVTAKPEGVADEATVKATAPG